MIEWFLLRNWFKGLLFQWSQFMLRIAVSMIARNIDFCDTHINFVRKLGENKTTDSNDDIGSMARVLGPSMSLW